jgi:hypothetical protein
MANQIIKKFFASFLLAFGLLLGFSAIGLAEPVEAGPKILAVPKFNQRDYGGCIKYKGCAVTAVAMVLRYYGTNATPVAVKNHNGGCYMNWSKMKSYDPNRGIKFTNNIQGINLANSTKYKNMVKSNIEKGFPVIFGYNYSHWVVAVGYSGGNKFQIIDPTGGKEKTIDVASSSNRVRYLKIYRGPIDFRKVETVAYTPPGKSERLYQSAVRRNKELYTRYTVDGNNWTSWQKSLTSLGDVKMVVFKDRLYQFAPGGIGTIRYRYTDGNSWSSWYKIAKKTPIDIEAQVYMDRLYISFRDYNNKVQTGYTTDGGNWSWDTNGRVTNAAVEMEVFKGVLYQVISAKNAPRIYMRKFNEKTMSNWGSWKYMDGVTHGKLTLGTYMDVGFGLGKMYMLRRGLNGTMYIKSTYDGENWSSWSQDTRKIATNASLYSNGSFMMQAVRGEGGAIYTKKFHVVNNNWESWSNGYGGSTFGDVDMVIFKNHLYLSAFGKTKENNVYVNKIDLSSNNSTGWVRNILN